LLAGECRAQSICSKKWIFTLLLNENEVLAGIYELKEG